MKLAGLAGQLRANWRPILAVHLFFTLLGVAVLTPLFGLLVRGVLSLSGTAAVADQDIAYMLLSPFGLAAGIALVAIFLGIAALELGALQVIAQGAVQHHAIPAVAAGRYALRKALPLLRLTLELILRVLAYLLPYLAAVAAVAWLLLTEHDINYYLSQRPVEFRYALFISGLLTLVLVWLLGRRLLGWSMVLPLVLFGATPPGDAFGESERVTTGEKTACLKLLLVWLALAALLALIPALFLGITTGWLLSAGIGHLPTLLVLMGCIALGWSLLNFLVAALTLAGFTLVIAALYRRLVPGQSQTAILEQLRIASVRRDGSLSLGAIAAIVIGLATVAVIAGILLLRQVQVQDDVLVVAHRGAAGAAPENTLASVRRALDDGADWVEIDVQETRDGHVVVVHDSDFMKLAGNPLKVWEGDLAEIRQIDVGSWFDPEFAGQKVPTLEEVLAAVRGRSRLVIELKYYGHDQQLEQRVVDIVESMGMADQVVVMSLKLPGIERLKALRPEWTAGLLAATALGDLTRLDLDFLAVNQKLATPAFIKRAHDSGKGVYVWTVDDGLSLSRWMSMGVDGVITNEPALAKDILAQRADLSSAERLLLSLITLFGKPELARQYRDNSP